MAATNTRDDLMTKDPFSSKEDPQCGPVSEMLVYSSGDQLQVPMVNGPDRGLIPERGTSAEDSSR